MSGFCDAQVNFLCVLGNLKKTKKTSTSKKLKKCFKKTSQTNFKKSSKKLQNNFKKTSKKLQQTQNQVNIEYFIR